MVVVRHDQAHLQLLAPNTGSPSACLVQQPSLLPLSPIGTLFFAETDHLLHFVQQFNFPVHGGGSSDTESPDLLVPASWPLAAWSLTQVS